MEVSAGWRRRRYHDRASGDRREFAQGHTAEDGSGSAPIDAVRRLVLPWRLGRCRMESRWRPPGIRLNLARPQAGMATSRRYIHRSGARGDGRNDEDVLRERQWQSELAL